MNQAQKMEAVGQLTGGVAHDFNNLLAIIIGNLELLSARTGEDANFSKYAAQALAATERGAELTQRLLAFSRKQPLRPMVIDISELVAGMRDLLARSLGAKVEISMTGGQDIWPCEVDPGQLENAVLNLSINARDAMPQGGRLTIETSNVAIEAEYAAGPDDMAMGQYVLLAVIDSCEGMTEEVIAQAFNPFFTTKDVGQGSGLGLSMIYGFAKQSGGHARIYSEVGTGTTVKIYLPRTLSDEPAAPGLASHDITEVALRGETVVVVEDDEEVRIVATSFLKDLGYRVLGAPAAAEALAQINQKAEIDLLVADVILPGGMVGRELAERACELLPALKVLFISGYTQDAIMHHGRLDEGVPLLAKPFGQANFARKIREILDNES